MKNITGELITGGDSSEDIAKIWGNNSMRVMSAVQNLAD